MIPRVLLATLAVAPAALAQADRPVTTPTRDVDVFYRTVQGEQSVTQRSRWSVDGQKMRLDTPTPGVYLIVDYAAHTLAMVSDRVHGVLDLPPPPGGMPGQGISASAPFARRGSKEVAGLPCTEWEMVDTQGQATTACFTDDGVLLEARRGAVVLVQATRVAYGALDSSVFVVPPSYSHEKPRSNR